MSTSLSIPEIDLSPLAELLPTAQDANGAPCREIIVRTLDQFTVDPATNGHSLIGNRFLCRGGGLLLAGPTGIGKSVLVIMMVILFALGRTFFGLKSSGKLRILIIQAENDDGDISEMRDGIFRGLRLSEDEQREACERIKVVCESSVTGDGFIELVAELAREHKPDLLILDPLFAYLGDSVSEQKAVSAFLRNGLNPILQENGCGVILIHHTNKPPQGIEKKQWLAGDFAYIGSGSSELANWARAVIGLRSLGSHDIFELVFGKRGKRAGIVNEAGKPVFSMFIKHAPAGICWEAATEDEAAAAKPGKKPAAAVEDVLRLIPLTGSISQGKLFKAATTVGIGKNRLRDLLAVLVEDKQAHVWHTPRPGTNPAKSYSRYEQELINR